MNDSPMNAALRHFEATEANLGKLERVLTDIEAAIPSDVAFFQEHPEYEDNCRTFHLLWAALPKIDDWKPDVHFMDLNEIAQNRLDAREPGEVSGLISVEEQMAEPARVLRDYRFRFNQKRRELIRDSLLSLVDTIDSDLRALSKQLDNSSAGNEPVGGAEWDSFKENVAQIDTCSEAAYSARRAGRTSIATCILVCLGPS